MRYFVEVSGKEYSVEVNSRADGSLAVTVAGKTIDVDAISLSHSDWSMRFGGRMVDMTVEGAPPVLGAVLSGRRTYVKVESERSRAANRASGGGTGAREKDVRSPMPGRVVKVLVQPGEEVGAGQAVAIVEAMKMENEVRAKKGGKVARVHCNSGQTVEPNAVLVSFE
jgi:glutaconyl-CoA/methylmalonyl-CoA decarboxylase subunit gamma